MKNSIIDFDFGVLKNFRYSILTQIVFYAIDGYAGLNDQKLKYFIVNVLMNV